MAIAIMEIASIGNYPLMPLRGNPAQGIGLIIISTLALHALSKLPVAAAVSTTVGAVVTGSIWDFSTDFKITASAKTAARATCAALGIISKAACRACCALLKITKII